METELVSLYEQKQTLQTELEAFEVAYYTARGDTDQIEKELRTQQRNAAQTQTLLNELTEQRNRLDLQFLSTKERLYAECRVELDELLDLEPTETDRAALEERLNKLRKQLDNYGEINPLAIEAFTEVEERFTFISTQRQDLLDAKRALLQTIKEIETTATEQFMTAFNQVRAHFIEVFRTLFTAEDHCDLVLLDPNDPLESRH